MNRYLDSEASLTQVLYRSFRLHYLTLKHTILCLLAIALIKYLSTYFALMTRNVYVESVIYVISAVFAVYFFSAALLATHRAFIDQPQSFLDSLKVVWEKKFTIFVSFFGYVIGFFIVLFFADLLIAAVNRLFHEPSVLHGFSLLLKLTALLMYLAMFSLAFPLSVIDDEKSFYTAFTKSIVFSEKNKLGIFLLFLMLGITFLLISPQTVQEYFLTMYHLEGVFDFVVLCVLAPLFINALLMIIHDSKLRRVDET